jgi:hypothetical protein
MTALQDGRPLFPMTAAAVPLVHQRVDGPTLTAAAAASCLDASVKGANFIYPANTWKVGKTWKILAQGRISCVVTTPGTARFDVRLGPTSTIVVFDTGALNLNVVAKTTIPWWLDIQLVCRSIGSGTSATLFGFGMFTSEAVVGAPANSAGGNGSLLCPVGTPAVGTGFDSTVDNQFDCFFTQTVATGSMTVHNFEVWEIN